MLYVNKTFTAYFQGTVYANAEVHENPNITIAYPPFIVNV